MQLRDYQTKALDDIRQAMREGARRLMVCMPTGAGKTELAAAIVNGAQGRAKRVIFTVPAISLIDQTVERFYGHGIKDVGVIQANHHLTDWSKPIQVASVQTLERRSELPKADVVIQDEAHKLFKFMLKWMTDLSWRQTPFIGLSATPYTKGLGRVYERLITGTTTAELIARGVLAPFKVLAPSHPDLSGVRTVAGDYVEVELSAAMQQGRLIADIVQTWLDKAEGRPTICFAVDRQHAKVLQERFQAAGVSAAYMDCMTPLSERNDIHRQFQRGEVKVVCNVAVLGIGVDWPEIGCISYCRPTKSTTKFVQDIGRGLRKHPLKQNLLVLDHSDTHLRLGFVTDISCDRLHTGKEQASAPVAVRLPKECKACGFLRPYGALVCPNCGHQQPAPPVVTEYSKGTLREYTGKKQRGKSVQMTAEEKAIFYAELKGYALMHNYKPGWAANKYRDRFDVWPNWVIKDVSPISPTPATHSWIKAMNIRWSKSKANPRNGHAAAPITQNPVTTPPPPVLMPPAFIPGTLCTEQDLRDFVDLA